MGSADSGSRLVSLPLLGGQVSDAEHEIIIELQEARELIRQLIMDWVPTNLLAIEDECPCSAHRAERYLKAHGQID